MTGQLKVPPKEGPLVTHHPVSFCVQKRVCLWVRASVHSEPPRMCEVEKIPLTPPPCPPWSMNMKQRPWALISTNTQT